jgi:hypothetical protein
MNRILSTRDLFPSERRFLGAMDDLWYGRFERIPIVNGELVLEPWPVTVRGVKFGPGSAAPTRSTPGEFELKRQVVELFEYVRTVDKGEILSLEIQHSLPFSMEVSQQPEQITGARRG